MLRASTRTITKSLNPAAREKARIDAVKEIATVNDAVAKLVSREYSVPDQEYSITHLATILFQLTATLPAEGASIVKAVAILLNELDLDNHAEHMADALMTALRDPLQEFIETSASVQSHADRVINGHDSIENCVLEIVSRVDKLQDAFRVTQEKAEASYNTAQNMISTLDKRLPSPDNQIPPPPQPNASNPNSYASRTRAQIPELHNRIMTRNEERQKQIMFTKAHGMPSQGLDNQEPHIIVAKANLALTAMKSNHDNIPEAIQFMSAKILAKGDILFDMNSPESVEWIRKEGNRMEFMQGFGAMSEIKDREYACVVENVPIGFHPSHESTLEIETTNDLATKAISLARWIKPVERRFEGQRTAFMIINFRSADDTNKAIRNSLYIRGKRCITRKLLPEPRRCYKCHAINAHHVAASCREITDICDTCGGAHSPKECQISHDDYDKLYCVNCKIHGHAARDRLCPTFTKHCNDLNARMPENLYKYFPTDKPSSWELYHHPTPDPYTQHPTNDEPEEWTQATNKKKKYNYPKNTKVYTNTATLYPNSTNATSANAIPIGSHAHRSQPQTHTQTFLDDLGIANSTRPGPSQQYRTPSQRQRAENHRATNSLPQRSTFSPLSAAQNHQNIDEIQTHVSNV
jgi:hypothetical protein